MENQAANKRQKYDDDVDFGSGSDRISRLPEHVLLHILCFLSQKKAVQTSVLSKSWRHLGPTRPVIHLRGACRYNDDLCHVRGVCENCFNGNNEAFISVLDNTFQRYHHRNFYPQELRLEMLELDPQSNSVLEKWIPIFINPNNPAVTTISLSHFNQPSLLFKAEYLRELCLERCRVDENILIDDVMLRNLQYLSLQGVEISDEALEKVILGCPLLKRLDLSSCPDIKTIIINGNKNNSLNCLDIYCRHADPNETSIAINAQTLESIRIDGGMSNWYPTNSNYFPHLKYLFLSYVTLSTDSFHYFSCNFPCLQELALHDCRGFEEIELSSCSIKRLIIHASVEKLAINAPNILYFEFSTDSLPTTFSLTTTSKEWKSHLDLCDYVYGHGDDDVLQRILKLFEMVKELRQSKISLTLFEFQYFEIKQWDFNDHPVVVEHLALGFENLCPDSHVQFLNALFRIIRPIYTDAMSAPRKDYKEITEFLWKTLIHDRGKTEHGWEQYLEEVSIEASDEKGKVWHGVKWTCFPEWSKNQTIRFRLKWRD